MKDETALSLGVTRNLARTKFRSCVLSWSVYFDTLRDNNSEFIADIESLH